MNTPTNSLRIESVTPEKATEYLQCNYSHNRKIRKNHVLFLANEMRAGRFMPTAEIHIMYRNGDPVLVNGQHTCSAIVEYGRPVSVTVRKTVTREPGQIAMTYAFGHDTGLRRTFNDAMGAYNIAEVSGLQGSQVEYLSTALRHIKNGFGADSGGNSVKSSPADLVDYIYIWAPDARILYNTMAHCDRDIFRLMRKGGSLSIAILTIYYQLDKALEFWRGIAMPDRLSWSDPRVTARRYLEDSKKKPNTHGVSAGRLSRQLARCWNAYYRGEELKQVKVMDEYAPVILLGTPYTGKQPKDFLSTKNELSLVA